MKSLALLILHVLIHVAFTKDCIFPIQTPNLQDVIVSHNATGVNPVATVVIRTEYPLAKMTWFVSKYGENNGHSFSVKDGEDGMSIKKINLSNKDVQISLYTEVPIEMMFGIYIIDVGCTTLKGVFSLNVKASNKAFTPFKSAKILKAPQEINIYESDKPFDMYLIVEADYQYLELEHNLLVYRNGNEIVTQKRGRRKPPWFTDLPSSRVAPRSENLHDYSARITVPKEIKKFISEFVIRQPRFVGDNDEIVPHSSVTYVYGFLTEETAFGPIFTVKQCGYNLFDYVNPFIDEDDVLVMPQEVGTMGCLYVIADGNPLPEMALAEMSGNNLKRILHPVEYAESLVIMKVGGFKTHILKEGETSEYQLVVQSTQGFRHQRIRIETYVPVSVSVPDRSFTTLSPRRLDLTCDVQGDFVSVGLYKSWQSSMEYDPSTWEPITITPTSRPGTYTFTLDLNEDLINQLNYEYKVVFCGVKTRYPTIFGSSQYQFDLMPTPTTWY